MEGDRGKGDGGRDLVGIKRICALKGLKKVEAAFVYFVLLFLHIGNKIYCCIMPCH